MNQSAKCTRDRCSPAAKPMSLKCNNTHDWIIIGISGVTCGGKTTLSEKLANTLTPSYVFNQDRYFYEDDNPNHVKVKGLDTPHNNYDILSALDMKKMYEDVVATLNGDDKSSLRNEERREGQLSMKGKKFMVIEGFTVLNCKPILNLCHMRYYLVLEYGVCCQRRSLRVYSPPDVDGYFEKCVWPEHLRYKAEIERDSSIKKLDGARPDSLERVIDDLKSMGCTPLTTP